MFPSKKQYGSYKTDTCPFCQNQAFVKNTVGLSVCKDHKNTEYPEIRCACGSWLDVLSGKFGTYCSCPSCGTINLSKALEVHQELYGGKSVSESKKDVVTPTNTTKEQISIRQKKNNTLSSGVKQNPLSVKNKVNKIFSEKPRTFSSDFERFEYERMKQ